MIGSLAIGIPWAYVSYVTLRQRATPAFLQGRVSAAFNIAFNGPQTFGAALGAVMITVVDDQVVAAVMSIVIVACGLLALRSPDVTPVVESVDHDDAPQRSHGQAVD